MQFVFESAWAAKVQYTESCRSSEARCSTEYTALTCRLLTVKGSCTFSSRLWLKFLDLQPQSERGTVGDQRTNSALSDWNREHQ